MSTHKNNIYRYTRTSQADAPLVEVAAYIVERTLEKLIERNGDDDDI